jgi:HAMP domain-containing protein
MNIDPVLILSQLSGLLGALIGGGASLAVAVYTHRSQDRLQRVAHEVAKRETIYAAHGELEVAPDRLYT